VGVPASRRLFVLAIVVAAALACALAFAWMRRARRGETLEERARDKATEMQERARELTK
jgi:hypothetical protein